MTAARLKANTHDQHSLLAASVWCDILVPMSVFSQADLQAGNIDVNSRSLQLMSHRRSIKGPSALALLLGDHLISPILSLLRFCQDQPANADQHLVLSTHNLTDSQQGGTGDTDNKRYGRHIWRTEVLVGPRDAKGSIVCSHLGDRRGYFIHTIHPPAQGAMLHQIPSLHSSWPTWFRLCPR